MKLLGQVYALLFCCACIPFTNGSTVALEEMFERMTSDTLAFARYLESLLTEEAKCDAIQDCSESNYDSCASEFPFLECPGNDVSYAIHVDECGSGKKGGCGGFIDFTASKVSLAPSIRTALGSEEDHVKDTVCWTLAAEQEMIRISDSAKDYWDTYSVSPPVFYFGADNGVFRQYPATADKLCDKQSNSSYDPRVRPWYVAASSGPKDIILVLDVAFSMRDDLRLAASRVISTLGIGDYFAVVNLCNNDVTQLGKEDLLLSRATDDNKKAMLGYINRLRCSGGRDYYSGFEKAFDTFKRSNTVEFSTPCRHQAILFVTDGNMDVREQTEQDLYEMIDLERNRYTLNGKNPPVIFTYSYGDSASEEVPQKLACRYDGIWSRISDEENLVDSMGGYYKYFSYGLGDQRNDDFVAWVLPYVFANGGSLGTTVSAPVYDRSSEHPVLVGVVGFDFTLAAMERALGKEGIESRDIIIEDIVEKSIAKCPIFNLTTCQMESLRMYGTDPTGFPAATCETCPSTIPSLESASCTTEDLSFVSLWANVNVRSYSFEERACCNVGESRAAGTVTLSEVREQVCEVQDPVRKESTVGKIFYIVSMVVGSVILICMIASCQQGRKTADSAESSGAVVIIIP